MLSDMFSPFTQGMDENQQAQLLMGLGARLLQGAGPRVKGTQNFAGIAGDAMLGTMQDSHSIRGRGFESKLKKLKLDELQRQQKKAERIQKQQEKVSTKLSGPSNVGGLGADMYPLLPENMPIDMSNPQQKMGLGQDMMNLSIMQGNPALTKMAGSMMNPQAESPFPGKGLDAATYRILYEQGVSRGIPPDKVKQDLATMRATKPRLSVDPNSGSIIETRPELPGYLTGQPTQQTPRTNVREIVKGGLTSKLRTDYEQTIKDSQKARTLLDSVIEQVRTNPSVVGAPGYWERFKETVGGYLDPGIETPASSFINDKNKLKGILRVPFTGPGNTSGVEWEQIDAQLRGEGFGDNLPKTLDALKSIKSYLEIVEGGANKALQSNQFQSRTDGTKQSGQFSNLWDNP